MGILNAQRLANASKGFRAIFFQALEEGLPAARKILDLLTTSVDSTGPDETYDWLGDVPAMEEWIDERKLKSLRDYGFTIRNKEWANGIDVRRTVIEDDKLGIVKPRIQMMADEAIKHQKRLIISLLNDGFSTACYDGKYFFAANHEDGDSGAQSNLDDEPLDATAYEAARVRMMSLKNDVGNSLEIVPTHLIVDPANEGTAREILQAERNSAGATNIWRGTADVLVVHGLADAKYWYLADLSKPIKPFILQNRRAVQFTALDNLADESVFMNGVFKYGADYRGNAGYAFWQLIHGSTGAD